MNMFSLFIMGFTVFVVLFIVIVIGKGIAQWVSNNHSPVLEVRATMVTKRNRVSHSHNGEFTHIRHHYYLTFEDENGERREFAVTGEDYGLAVEGDTGILTFQGTRFKGFRRD